ncbi:SigE family RNA polymerase sigma factor [Planosporangium sp. 12N6]|uniref:SigE family RNA polymerase sigma factor n=1 Tax=Planosporangium spinosum TaxID=3402278 RepID=UPI003CF8DD7F
MDVEQSFDAYVRSRGASLFRTAYVLTGDHHLAEDLVQEALLRLAGRWRQVASAGDPDAYVRRTLYHQHVSWWRRRRRGVTEVKVEPPQVAALDASGDVPSALAVWDALARLAPRQRAVLVLRYYEDLSEAQTAAILGVRVGTVKSQVRDALARLRVLAPELSDRIDLEVTP